MGTVFALSWLITWYGHVIAEHKYIVRLFDFFVATHPLMPLYVAAAMGTFLPNTKNKTKNISFNFYNRLRKRFIFINQNGLEFYSSGQIRERSLISVLPTSPNKCLIFSVYQIFPLNNLCTRIIFCFILTLFRFL